MTGWEFWGLKFSWFLVSLISLILFVYVWLHTHGVEHMTHVRVDRMAGDEGED